MEEKMHDIKWGIVLAVLTILLSIPHCWSQSIS